MAGDSRPRPWPSEARSCDGSNHSPCNNNRSNEAQKVGSQKRAPSANDVGTKRLRGLAAVAGQSQRSGFEASDMTVPMIFILEVSWRRCQQKISLDLIFFGVV